MTKKRTIAPIDKLLAEVKEEQLNKPWTPEASEIVDRIDEVLDGEA